MKLVIKRDPRRSAPDSLPGRPIQIDGRSLLLCAEDGTPLPCQSSLFIESEPHRPPKVIVTFILDGDRVSLE